MLPSTYDSSSRLEKEAEEGVRVISFIKMYVSKEEQHKTFIMSLLVLIKDVDLSYQVSTYQIEVSLESKGCCVFIAMNTDISKTT